MKKRASAVWIGSIREGQGTISTETGVLREAGFLVHLDAPLAEDSRGPRVHLVRNQYAHLLAHAVASHAQSSHGPSASMSAVSTVAPHQMRRPGGASR